MKMPSTERFLGNERARSVFDTHNRSSSATWNSHQMNVLFLLRIASLLMCWLYIHVGTSAHPYDVRYHIWISTSIGFPSFLLFNRSSICSTLPSKTFAKEIALPRVATRCCRRIGRVFYVVECMYMYVNNFALCWYIKDCALGKCVSFARLIIGERQERTPDIQLMLSRTSSLFLDFCLQRFFLTDRTVVPDRYAD